MSESQIHADNIAYIDSNAVRDAYRYIIGYAACLDAFHCFPRPFKDGGKRSFRFSCAESDPYSFITNKGSLLFYFRKPSQGHRVRSVKLLKQYFSEVNENELGEVTVRLSDFEQARLLMNLIFSDQASE